ncbi:MAG TPA: hypothetical protein VJS44_04225, partial [Pyrinomonadaceae bacterium]|nr:hypothetical protein [Pyrinomonadaceae bacterium]
MAEVRENLIAGGNAEGLTGVDAPKKRYYPQLELTLARLREFSREPELIFWVFIFPLLLTFSLGIAFRNNGPEKVYIGVET